MYGVAPEHRVSFKVVSALEMLHSAARTLFCYDPANGKWLQAHAQGRFMILKASVEWGKGAVSIRQVDGTYKIFVDKDNLGGLAEAVAKLLIYLNFYKAARLPDEAAQFMKTMSALDDFWLDFRKQAEQLKPPRGVFCGAVTRKTDDGYTLERCGVGAPTVLNVVESIVESAKLALD
jgi:hypothetical protein